MRLCLLPTLISSRLVSEAAAVVEQVKSGKNPKSRPCPCQELTSSTVFFRINVDQINNIQDLINLLKPNVKDLMNAYVDLNEEWQKQEEFFLKMMILDASFIIAIFRANCLGYCGDRTIFSKDEKLTIIPLIKKDMLLLENQLPFSAIWKLMDVFKLRLIWFVTSNVPAEFPDLEDLPHEQVATLYKTN
ncbi:hypothetical protein ACLOJK_032005 [Asimina triloba]